MLVVNANKETMTQKNFGLKNSLNFKTPMYWATGDNSVSNADFPTTKSRLFQLGSQDINGIMYGIDESNPLWFDNSSSYTKRPPYWQTSGGFITNLSTTARIMNRNFISSDYIEEGLTIGEFITINIGCDFNAIPVTQNARLESYLIDDLGTLSTIDNSMSYTSMNITSSAETRHQILQRASSGLVASGGNKKLFIKLQMQISYSSSNTFALYSDYFNYNNNNRDGAFITCSIS